MSDSVFHGMLLLKLAFPYRKRAPPGLQQGDAVTAVALFIPFQLGEPVVEIFTWRLPPGGAVMPVPEASVNKDDCPVSWEHEVRRPRKVWAVQTEAIAHRMHKLADSELGLGVLLPDS